MWMRGPAGSDRLGGAAEGICGGTAGERLDGIGAAAWIAGAAAATARAGAEEALADFAGGKFAHAARFGGGAADWVETDSLSGWGAAAGFAGGAGTAGGAVRENGGAILVAAGGAIGGTTRGAIGAAAGFACGAGKLGGAARESGGAILAAGGGAAAATSPGATGALSKTGAGGRAQLDLAATGAAGLAPGVADAS